MTTLTHRFVLSIAALVVVIAFSAVAYTASAAVIRVGDTYTHGTESGAQGDAYLLGESVSVHGSSTDDLFVFAGTGDVLGDVGGDLLGAGGTMRISAPVKGDLRVAGGEIHISGNITEDALIFGGNVVIEESAHIGGDLLLYAEYVEIRGTVEGDADIFARNTVLSGTVQGHVQAEAGESLALQNGAVIGNGLTYRTPREIMIPEGVSVTGDIVHEPFEVSGAVGEDAEWPGILFHILMSLLAGVILLKLFPAFTRTASERVLSGTGTIALTGFATLLCVPVLAVLLMVTFLGFIPALFLLLAYGSVIVVACALAPVLAGAALASWLKKGDGQKWQWVSLGATALVLLTLVPIVGWIVRFLVFLTALGVMALLIHERVWKRRKGEETVAALAVEPPASDTPVAEVTEHHEENKEVSTEKSVEETAK